MYKYIHTCIYIHISCPHTYTHTHIYTHAYKMYIWTHAKHVWNHGATATARATQLDPKKLCPSPCLHHDSAPSRPHPLICTGVEPIHPVHCPRQLPVWPCRPMAPRNEVIFLLFWRGIYMLLYWEILVFAVQHYFAAQGHSMIKLRNVLHLWWQYEFCVETEVLLYTLLCVQTMHNRTKTYVVKSLFVCNIVVHYR